MQRLALIKAHRKADEKDQPNGTGNAQH
jgi:hypothetical protein